MSREYTYHQLREIEDAAIAYIASGPTVDRIAAFAAGVTWERERRERKERVANILRLGEA